MHLELCHMESQKQYLLDDAAKKRSDLLIMPPDTL